MAMENNRKRMLQRCLTGWHLLRRMQRGQGEILAQRQGTQTKMAAFINAVSTSKPEDSHTPNLKLVKAPVEAANHEESRDKVRFTLRISHCVWNLTEMKKK